MGSGKECILCQRQESVLVQFGARHAPEMEVRRCAGCGIVFLWPRPTEEELGRYYTDLYRQDYGEPSIQERHRTDLDEARIRVRRLLSYLHPDTRLLEAGSGSGAFVDAVGPYVGQVLGVEPDAASRAWIENKIGLRVLPDITDVLQKGETFDLIVLFHVLEHVPDPVDFLRTLGRLLRPAGKLVIEVPNVDDALVAVYRIPAYLSFYYQKAHLFYFARTTLAQTLEKAGFRATINGIQRYDVSNHIRWMLSGEPGGQGYYESILPSSVHVTYADALIRAGHSDTLWAITS